MASDFYNKDNTLIEKFIHLNWGLVCLITLLATIGVLALYSASGGSMDPWASKHLIRFGATFCLMLVIAMIHARFWFRLSWPIYFAGLGLLLIVEIMGHIGMGAQRWIDLGFMKLQPSELMKLAVILALARYYHNTSHEDLRKLSTLIIPILIIALPTALVLLQPDLGTSIMMVLAGTSVIFMAGAPLWIFLGSGALIAGSIPIIWQFLHDYQKSRVMTFLHPESDPLGSGYHITQSKIALGSGGIEGKGFLQGTQSHLNFLPEKQTDFIFTLWAEEWGLAGGLFILAICCMIFIYSLYIAMICKINFLRYLAMGLSVNFSLYIFVNVAMVMGLIPVVGAPLPLVSYGGTAMLATMIGFGLILGCSVHRNTKLNSGF